jgi:hypothetical protein
VDIKTLMRAVMTAELSEMHRSRNVPSTHATEYVLQAAVAAARAEQDQLYPFQQYCSRTTAA